MLIKNVRHGRNARDFYSCHSFPSQCLIALKTSILIILHLNTSRDGELIISEFHEYPNLWALKNALMTLLVELLMVCNLC